MANGRIGTSAQDTLQGASHVITRLQKRGGGFAGDRFGLLLHRGLGTMQVFINGVQQPVVAGGIPGSGELYFVVELLADGQALRIIEDALPPLTSYEMQTDKLSSRGAAKSRLRRMSSGQGGDGHT